MVEIIGESGKNEARITITDGADGQVKVTLAFKKPVNLGDPEYKGTLAERLAVDAMTFIKGLQVEQRP